MSSVSIRGQLLRAFGRGVKLFSGTVSITGTGAVTVSNATAVLDAVATVSNYGTGNAAGGYSCGISSISGVTINVQVQKHKAATNSVDSVAKSVSILGTAI